MAVQPGDILGNKYRVDALIGRGGMGHVFAATDLARPTLPVAIKVVSRVVHDETLMARLHREAEAAARIRSDYVPRVIEISDTAERELFLVMERLVGEPLSERMRQKGPLPWAEVVRIGEDVLRGLIDAHTAGVVHRDLKPSNVFLAVKDGRTRAMVLDFGVCKMDTVDTEHLTGTGEAIGTVAYMAPEQIRGASKVDDRADLYAFGVLVFEMVCGRLPHDGPTQMAILASKLEREPARLRDASGVPTPEGLDALVARALARDLRLRFTSAQELLKAWRALGAADRASSPGAITAADLEYMHDPDDAPTTVGAGRRGLEGGVPVEAHPTNTALTAGISLRKGGSGRVALLLAAGALVAGVISVGAFFARGPDAVGARGAALSAGLPLDPTGAPPGSSEPASAGPSGAIGPSAATVSASAVANPGTLSPSAGSTEALSDPAPASLASAAPIELDGLLPASAATQAPAAKADPKRAAPRGRPARPPAAPRSSGPHITSAPRY